MTNLFHFSGEVLEMKNISDSYEGIYICNAANGVGHKLVRKSVTLKVLCKHQLKHNCQD